MPLNTALEWMRVKQQQLQIQEQLGRRTILLIYRM